MSGAPIPGELPEPTPAPDGSSAQDAAYVITSENLALLGDDTKSSLLAVSNLGSAITSRINSTLDLIEVLTGFEAFAINANSLNDLANDEISEEFTIANTGNSHFVRIVILLGEITPTSGATIVLSDTISSYELSVPTTTSEKRLVFDNVVSSFAESFYIQNLTGVPLASYGNSIVVIPL